jgi:hypothetical protein
MDIAIVGGTGKQGFGIALRMASAGHRVTIGSREALRATEAAERAGARVAEASGIETALAGTDNASAVASAGLVVLTVPYPAQRDTLASIESSLRPDAIVVVTSNPLAADVMRAPGAISSAQQESAAEEAAAALPAGVRVVAGFQTVAAKHLQALERPVEGDVLLCGDDDEAKRVVGGLVEDIPALRWVDAGALSMARAVERLTGLLISVNHRYRIAGATVRIEGRDGWGRPPEPGGDGGSA